MTWSEYECFSCATPPRDPQADQRPLGPSWLVAVAVGFLLASLLAAAIGSAGKKRGPETAGHTPAAR